MTATESNTNPLAQTGTTEDRMSAAPCQHGQPAHPEAEASSAVGTPPVSVNHNESKNSRSGSGTAIVADDETSSDQPDPAVTSGNYRRGPRAEWTDVNPDMPLDEVLHKLCDIFNTAPFFHYCQMEMRLVDDRIEGHFEQSANLIGNTAFGILHGGVAATMLDSIGGVVAMGEIYRRGHGDIFERTRQVRRLATIDLRVDYISPGRSLRYIATAEVLRMGRKGCTTRMDLHDDQGKLIATGTAAFAY